MAVLPLRMTEGQCSVKGQFLQLIEFHYRGSVVTVVVTAGRYTACLIKHSELQLTINPALVVSQRM